MLIHGFQTTMGHTSLLKLNPAAEMESSNYAVRQYTENSCKKSKRISASKVPGTKSLWLEALMATVELGVGGGGGGGGKTPV